MLPPIEIRCITTRAGADSANVLTGEFALRLSAAVDRFSWNVWMMGTWWIDEPTLMGSANPTDADLGLLRASGCSVIVCLLDLQEQPPAYDTSRAVQAGWEWHNIAIRDFSAPSLEQRREFVALVATSLPEKRIVVHCQGGSGRTGTMAGAHWVSRCLSACTWSRSSEPRCGNTSGYAFGVSDGPRPYRADEGSADGI